MWQTIREMLLRVAGTFMGGRRERERAEELEFHLALKQSEYKSQGASSAQAANLAHRDFGGLQRWKERCRDATTVNVLEDLGRDLRLAIRVLWKSPTFTFVAVATLASAMSANTTIFSLMNAVLLKSVEVPHPDRLTLLRIQPGEYGYSFPYPWFKRIEKESANVAEVFAFVGTNLRVKSGETTENEQGQFVSGNYFSTLHVTPALGRYINAQDDQPGTPNGNVAVISHAYWRSRFNSDRSVLGRKLTANGTVLTVVGIMPESFRGMDRDARPNLWIPLECEPQLDAPFNNIAGGYQVWWLRLGARLNENASFQTLQAFLKTDSRRLVQGKEMPADFSFNGYKLSELRITAEPGLAGYSGLRLRFAKPLRVLMLLVGLVLLVACLNLATLLIARAAARRRELSTRFALGASRFRLVRQLLTECLVLSLAGTLIGAPAAMLLTRGLAVFIAPPNSFESAQLDTAADPMVFAFTAAIAIFATLIVGVAPALRSTAGNLQAGLREGSANLRAVERRRIWPRILLASEVGIALVVVSGASLLGHSFLKLHQVPLGFDPAGLVHLTLDARQESRPNVPLVESYRQLTERLRSLPSVSEVSICDNFPLSGSTMTTEVTVPGKSGQPVWQTSVGPGYFRTMHTTVREGREFRWSDTGSRGDVAILNASAEKLLFPGQHPLGQHVSSDGKTQLEVIGVVSDAKYSSVRDPSPPTIYFPVMSLMNKMAFSFTVLLRTSGSVAPVVAAAKQVAHREFPEIPLPVAITMSDTLNESLASERVMTMLAAFFAVLALAITAIGLYGTLAYMTERRTGEIGIRIALGARPASIAALVCRENSAIALSGCLAGLIASLLASKLIASFLFNVPPRDPLAFGATVTALVLVATGASLVPAMRAARIDPIAAIRHE